MATAAQRGDQSFLKLFLAAQRDGLRQFAESDQRRRLCEHGLADTAAADRRRAKDDGRCQPQGRPQRRGEQHVQISAFVEARSLADVDDLNDDLRAVKLNLVLDDLAISKGVRAEGMAYRAQRG